MAATDAVPPSIISTTTILSLLSTVAILLAAYFASLTYLPRSASVKTRILFVWHAFDALIHLILEAAFLYNCFFSWAPTNPSVAPSAYLPPNIYFLDQPDRLYGSAYGNNPLAALWREYAKADARWEGSDLNIISLELLTVLIAGPLAVWVCVALSKGRGDVWFWMTVLATGELYGGWMTFAPEWLSGSKNLDTSNWMYLWLYLTFFNGGLWVLIPGWILWEAYGKIAGALGSEEVQGGKVKKGKKSL